MKIKYKIILIILICFLGIMINCNSVLAAYEIKIVEGSKEIYIGGDPIKLEMNTVESQYVSFAYGWSTDNSDIVKLTPITEKKEVVVGSGVYAHKEIKDVQTKSATVQGIKEGEATIKCNLTVSSRGGTSTKTYKIKIKVKHYKEMDLNKLDKNASASEIKHAILADTNNEKLKEIAKNDIEKIKAWSKTVNNFIATDRNHYGQENQYGAIKSVLEDIIEANEKGESIDTAVSNNSQGLSNTQQIVDSFIKRISMTSNTGEERKSFIFSDVLTDTGKYKPIDEAGDNRLTDKASIVLTLITNIAMIVAVLMLAVIGLKYMLGSVEEKAEYKKDMVPYLVGAMLVFGITVIVKVLQQFGQSINNV